MLKFYRSASLRFKALYKSAFQTARVKGTALATMVLFSSLHAIAQPRVYADYAQNRGEVQAFQWGALPSARTPGFRLCGSTEGPTSLNYPGSPDRICKLTADYAAIDVGDASFLAAYLQSIDPHALGLPAGVTQSNLRATFNLRQGSLDLRTRPSAIPVELFSTSLATLHSISFVTVGAAPGLDGAHGSITRQVPMVHLSPNIRVHGVRGVTSSQGIRWNEVEAVLGSEVDGWLPARSDLKANPGRERGSYATLSVYAGENIDTLSYMLARATWTPGVGGQLDDGTGSHPPECRPNDPSSPSNHIAFDLFG